MAVWALADLHLAFGAPDKSMDAFGEPWIDYMHKIEREWNSLVGHDDLVLIPGDISWAMRIEDAAKDLEWIHRLPGEKVLLRGNHDYWWTSLSKIEKILPPSLHLIQNNSFFWKDIAIGGARLWDTPEYAFKEYIEYKANPRERALGEPEDPKEAEKIFIRELGRLEMSLKSLNPKAKTRIAMTHYAPIGADMRSSRASAILEKYQVDICVFGHLHNIKPGLTLFGEHHGVQYHLVSADYLNFKPLRLIS